MENKTVVKVKRSRYSKKLHLEAVEENQVKSAQWVIWGKKSRAPWKVSRFMRRHPLSLV